MTKDSCNEISWKKFGQIDAGAHVTKVAHDNECSQDKIWAWTLNVWKPVHIISQEKLAFQLLDFAQIMWVGPRDIHVAGTRIESSLEQEQGYQADEDAAELHDVRVGHRVEAADPGVEDRDQGRAHHRRVQLHVYYHRQGGA